MVAKYGGTRKHRGDDGRNAERRLASCFARDCLLNP